MEFSKKKVFFLDDDNFILLLAQKMLEARGYLASTFNNQEELLEALQNAPPDALILDYMMPGLDGGELITHIKTYEALRNIPILLYSAADPAILSSIIRKSGAVGYIQKGIKMTHFVNKMEELLGWEKSYLVS